MVLGWSPFRIVSDVPIVSFTVAEIRGNQERPMITNTVAEIRGDQK